MARGPVAANGTVPVAVPWSTPFTYRRNWWSEASETPTRCVQVSRAGADVDSARVLAANAQRWLAPEYWREKPLSVGPSWLTIVANFPLAGIAVRYTQADTVKLLPGAVSRTGPDVTKSLSVPLKTAHLPFPVVHQAMFEPLAGCRPMASRAVVPVTLVRGHQPTGFGTDTVAAAALDVVGVGCDGGGLTAGAMVAAGEGVVVAAPV